MEPHYESKEHGIKLYQGDAKEILPTLLEDGVKGNAVITDPPFGIDYNSNYKSPNYLLGRGIVNDSDLSVLEAILPDLDKLIVKDSALYFFAHSNMIGENRKILDQFWKHKTTLVWDKGEGGTAGDLEAGYSLNYENILYYNKGRRKLNGARPRAIFRHDHETSTARSTDEIPLDEYLLTIAELIYNLSEDKVDEVFNTLPQDITDRALREHPKAQIKIDWSSRYDPVHPNAKPVLLMKLLIKNSTNPGDLIIDPFMGSSPVGAACKILGRRYIGIEIDPDSFRIAQTRIQKTNKLTKV